MMTSYSNIRLQVSVLRTNGPLVVGVAACSIAGLVYTCVPDWHQFYDESIWSRK